jgi:hypothetical protein
MEINEYLTQLDFIHVGFEQSDDLSDVNRKSYSEGQAR